MQRLWVDRILVGERDECWSFAGPLHSRGYPRVSVSNKSKAVARYLASLTGPVSGPVHHRCENKACVNPTHLVKTESIAEHKRHHRSCQHDDMYRYSDGRSYCRTCRRERRKARA